MLINAPFDWLSIGLTRRLLGRGLQAIKVGQVHRVVGWGLLDMLIAMVLVLVLATVVLFAVQVFNATTVAGGGTPLVPVGELLDALSSDYQRGQTQYWWLYAIVLSTLLPSMLHASIAAFALVCWVPQAGINALFDQDKGKPFNNDWWWIAGLLALLRVGSLAIGVGATVWLLTRFYGQWLPTIQFGWLDALQAMHKVDLPTRLIQAF